jgi:beta-xylosidase
MHWQDGWPIIGEPGPKPGIGQPVLTHVKPVQGMPVTVPPTSDEFNGIKLGLQWQWNANPEPSWYSLTERSGMLRLHTVVAPEANGYVRATPSMLTQKPPAPTFVVNTRVQLNGGADGDRAGLIVNAMQYAWIGLRKSGAATQLVYTSCTPAKLRCTESASVLLEHAPDTVYLRMNMLEGAQASFAYSVDNVRFVPAGRPLAISKGRWVGAQIGLFAVGEKDGAKPSSVDVDYFRVTAH